MARLCNGRELGHKSHIIHVSRLFNKVVDFFLQEITGDYKINFISYIGTYAVMIEQTD